MKDAASSLLKKIREQDFLSDDLRASIDDLLLRQDHTQNREYALTPDGVWEAPQRPLGNGEAVGATNTQNANLVERHNKSLFPSFEVRNLLLATRQALRMFEWLETRTIYRDKEMKHSHENLRYWHTKVEQLILNTRKPEVTVYCKDKQRCDQDGCLMLGMCNRKYLDTSKPMSLIEAFQLAAQLHQGQLDKAGRPYIEHLVRVFLRVLQKGGNLIQQIAALLHDAIEDERATAEDLRGKGVPEGAISLIEALTRNKKDSYNTYLQKIKGSAHFDALKIVKESDVEDNMDPERLSKLPPEVAARLLKKYQHAMSMLA